MKKIIFILAALIMMGTGSFAQTNTKTAAPTTTAQKAGAPKVAKMKKDGTPDMRYNENKLAAKPSPKLKKDGTPDKRYKANKSVTAPTSAATVPVKK
jgi:hypothetical protein